ncbi:MAG: DUF3108 domain-containing protein [Bacteroides sp.]|nr:DUF3108 domain-containing protein [Bacteroides sp.]
MMRRIATFILTLLSVALLKATSPLPAAETLNYKVMFKWGIVQKQAGRATLQLKQQGNTFIATLFARSEPWADRFYSLRDTLTSTMSVSDIMPVRYERIAHEDGKYARDVITMTRQGNSVNGKSVRYRRRKDTDPVSSTTISLQAEGPTVDLVSVFYYLRTIDFSTLADGHSHTINIFSGKRKELLTITYHGREELTLDGTKYPTYRLSFTFTDEKSSKTSDDIDTWIWANDTRIPLKLEGKLKVGKIRCLYTGKL